MGETIEIGETIRLRAQFYDWDNNLYDPTNVRISIWDNKKVVKIENVEASPQSKGNYYYDYIISSDEVIDVVEQWTYVFEGITGTSHLIDKGYFTVTDKLITTDYTTVLDIEMLLQKTIDDTTKPSMQEVVRLIKRKEDFIDQITGTSWREKIVTEEFHYQRENPIGQWWLYYNLKYGPVQEITGLWFRTWGHTFIDYFEKTNLWDLDENTLRVYRFLTGWTRWKSIKVSYKYGYKIVPRDISELCAKLVVIDLLKAERYINMLAAGADAVLNLAVVHDEYKSEIDRILDRYRKIRLE